MLFFKNKQQIARIPFHGSIPDRRSSLKIPEFILWHTGRSRNLPSGGVELITRCLGRSLSQMALLKHHDTIPTFPRLALNPPGWIAKAQLTFLEEIQAKECFRMLISLLSLLLTLFYINVLSRQKYLIRTSFFQNLFRSSSSTESCFGQNCCGSGTKSRS